MYDVSLRLHAAKRSMRLRIEKLIYGGDGLAHHDGNTVFIPFVLPGEEVEIRIVERKKKFLRGAVERLVAPAPARVSPPCAHFTVCGGCHYQHIPYDEQLRQKEAILLETLRRIGAVGFVGAVRLHPSPPLGYRNRAQWKNRATPAGPAIGYHRAGSSALCAVEACPVLMPALEDALRRLRALLAANSLPATLLELEAFASDDGRALLWNVALADFSSPPQPLADALRAAVPETASVLLHDASRDSFELAGPGFISCRSGDFTFRVSHLSFFQANYSLAPELAAAALDGASGRLALDLFAGVGLFTLPLAQRFSRVVAVESNLAAARDLEANLRAAQLHAEVLALDVARALERFSDRPDFVLLDPPRTGVEKAALERLIALSPPRIHYVSCDPATLARDLRLLLLAGYRLTALHLFDLFPQTFHIETLACLERAS